MHYNEFRHVQSHCRMRNICNYCKKSCNYCKQSCDNILECILLKNKQLAFVTMSSDKKSENTYEMSLTPHAIQKIVVINKFNSQAKGLKKFNHNRLFITESGKTKQER